MTLTVGRKVRITNGGKFDGQVGTITSTNGHIFGVEVGEATLGP